MSDATNQETVDIANQILAELAQAAKDGQLIQNDYYATEAAGRAAVADGETFKVQGSGEVAALLYRRLSASSSTQIAEFPSVAAVDSISRAFQGAVPVEIYSAVNEFVGYYLRTSDGALSASATAACAFIPVTPGNTYRIQASSFSASNFKLAYRASKALTVGASIAVGVLVDRGVAGEREFTVPNNADIKYACINVMLSSGAWDIRGSVSVHVISAIDFPDATARAAVSGLIAQEPVGKGDLGGLVVNLYDASRNVADRYINLASGSANYGNISVSAGTMLGRFPVTPGLTYRITASSFSSTTFGVILKANDDPLDIYSLNGLEPLVAETSSTRLLSVPLGSAAKFAFLNLVFPSFNWDIRASLKIEVVEEIGSIRGRHLADAVARQLFSGSTAGRLRGKRWVVVGDSITQKTYRSNLNYHDYVSQLVGGMLIDNYGIGGSGYYNRSGVADTITSSPDFITVFLGTNDWAGAGGTNLPLGAFGDTGTATMSGCINTLLSGLIAKFFGVPIGVVTPLPRFSNWGSAAAPNASGYTLKQLAELIKQYAAHYSLPLLDLYSVSNLPVWIAAANELYFTAPGETVPDGLHPNDAGHQVMGRKFIDLLARL